MMSILMQLATATRSDFVGTDTDSSKKQKKTFVFDSFVTAKKLTSTLIIIIIIIIIIISTV